LLTTQAADVRGTSAARLVAEGVAALERGDEASAKEAFRRALALDARNVEAHTYLGVIADRAGELAEAERHFAAAAAAAPSLASAHNNYGAILLRLGRTAQARAQFEASLALERDQPSALVNLAQIHFASGRPDDLRAARDLFARAARIAPAADTARALVVISLKLGDRAGASAAYRDYAAQLAAADPATISASSRAELGSALLEADLMDEALAELVAVTAADPSNVPATVALARAYTRRKDLPSAGRTLESAVARGIDAAPIYAALAEVYEAVGRVENAIPAMRLALARDPKNEAYHFRYGLLLTDASAPAASVIRLNDALKEFPSSPRLWLALGVAQLTKGDNAEAEASFNRSLALDPKSVPALAYLGTTYAERGDYARALAYYERAIADDERQAALYYLAADTMLKMPDADEAKAGRYLARAVELDPTLASARLALAKLYVRAERWTDAAAQLERAVQLAPDLNEAHYQLGRVYQRLQRPADARRELALFKERSENEKQQRETERRDLVRRLADVRF
jgi:Tfp pilus assembly protein PilF